MVSSKESAGDSGDGGGDGLPAEEVHQREVAGGVGVPPEVLAEHDAQRADLRGVGAWGQDARQGDAEDERGRSLRRGVGEE